MALNWECPHCGRAQTVIKERQHQIATPIRIGTIAEGSVSACALAIGCANPECNRLTLSFSVRPHQYLDRYYEVLYDAEPLYERLALPSSFAKPQPDCIPKPLVDDYIEACLIRDDSPKASATLARRCIQGMIRDFCGIQKGTLAKEIEALAAALSEGKAAAGVTQEALDAIDHVRSIGNIGAHMEKDIDLIIPVDPDEAYILIGLIEMLFSEWYVARDTRQKRLAAISEIAIGKKKLIADGKVVATASAQPKVEFD